MGHTFVTIAYSHYCERARWALQRAEVPFRERGYLPFFHLAGVALASRGRLGRADGTSTPLSTPLLVTPGGERIHDSGRIVAYAATQGGPRAVLLAEGEGAALERDLAAGYGVATRKLIYRYMLDEPGLVADTARRNVGPLQAGALVAGRPLFSALLKRALRVTPASADRAWERARRQLDIVDARLADGRTWLTGDRFTSVDLTLAALTVPVLGLTHREGFGAWVPPMEAYPPALRALVDEVRARPAGQLALRAYRDER